MLNGGLIIVITHYFIDQQFFDSNELGNLGNI